MEINNRNSIFDNIKKYCPSYKENDYIEITEWSNGDGWDININGKHLSLHWDELDAINYLTTYLRYNRKP